MDKRAMQIYNQIISSTDDDIYELDAGLCNKVTLETYRAIEDIALYHAQEHNLKAPVISRLIKTLVLLDNSIRKYLGIGIGSTSQIWLLFDTFKEGDEIIRDETYEWAFENTCNPYVPYGSNNRYRNLAISHRDYVSLIKEKNEKNQLRDEKEKERKAAKYAERQQLHKSRMEKQSIESTNRNSLIAELGHLTPAERLRRISMDMTHPPYFYPSDFAKVSESVLQTLDAETIKRLLSKLKTPPSGPWKKLGKMLEPHKESD